MATINVTTFNDENNGTGDISLREAILIANSNGEADTINLPAGTYTLNLAGQFEDAGATGDLDILADGGNGLTIIGDGQGSTIIDADGIDRVFDVQRGASLDVSELTVTGGETPSFLGSFRDTSGGGILVRNGSSLSVSNSTISGNSAQAAAGGIYNSGTANITGSTISGNSAGNSGGGIFTKGTANITGSTISGNSAGVQGGGIYNSGTANITGSTISGNSAGDDGGGIFNVFGTANITSSTISGNSAQAAAGGIYNIFGTANITSSTISGNSASSGSGVASFGNNSTFTNVTSSIISGNTGGGADVELVSGATDSFSSNGNNLIGIIDSNITAFNQASDITGVTDPLLGPLQDNGGPTFTQELLAGSPAIDAGSNPNGLATDQRGTGFNRVVGSSADIGAFEVQGSANTNPDAIDDEAITNAETVIDINVLDNDTDADGDNLSIDSFDSTSSLGATITENPDGSLSYDPNGQINLAIGETVTDSFTYTISDGTDTDTATVNLTIFDPSVIIIEGDNEPALDVGVRDEESLLILGDGNEADLGDRDDIAAVQGDGNQLNVGNGEDETTIEGNNNTVDTGLGADIVELSGEDNIVNAGGGNDDITVTGDGNEVEAGGGNDDITITGDGTTLDAGNGNDDITVTGDASIIDAAGGNDVVVVTGDDNVITGGRGDDDITGTGQNLIVDGGGGNDLIVINTDSELGALVEGGNDNDTITGSQADDILLGNQDDDVIDGRDGDDIIEGNKGTDNLTGGAGSDIFRFGNDAADGETNLIVDFQQGVDVLAIEDLDLNDFSTANGGTTYDFSLGNKTLTLGFTNAVTLSATDFTDYQNTFV